MQLLVKNKGILAIVAIFIIVMFAYNTFFRPEVVPTSSELSASGVGDDLLKMHSELQAVTLDRSLFSAPGYLRLTDFSNVIPPQPTGRPNPFDIIGRD